MIWDLFQTREALLAILDDIHEEDYFALVQFDHTIDFWKETLTKATEENVAEAMAYVKTIQDYGGFKKSNSFFTT